MAAGDDATVLLEISLVTQLAVSFPASSTTVAHLKQRVSREYAASYPNIGQIAVQSIKANQGGSWCELTDSMAVRDVFNGINNQAWRLKVEAALHHSQPLIRDQGVAVEKLDHSTEGEGHIHSKDTEPAVSGRHRYEGSSSSRRKRSSSDMLQAEAQVEREQPLAAKSQEKEHGTDPKQLKEAHAQLFNITFGYLKSMALESAIKLGILNAIHRCGGSASLSSIVHHVPAVPESKRPYLPRLLRFLAVSGVLGVNLEVATAAGREEDIHYQLNPISRLLVDEAGLSPFVLSQTTKHFLEAAMYLPGWFENDDPSVETPFKLAHGIDLWGIMGRTDDRAQMMNQVFNVGMASHSRFEMKFLLGEPDVFEGVNLLVDVGGGTGTAARTIADAFPHVKCSVLDLPNVIESIPPDAKDGFIDYIPGDMMQSIPQTDVVFLKHILHDWNDEDCVKILTKCREAIHPGGKVIVVDIVVGSSPAKEMLQAQLELDLLMMTVTLGKERDEQQWRNIFMQAGFSQHKTRPLTGFISMTQLYV